MRVAAGILSGLVPGLGHLLIGRRRTAALFLAPVVVALIVLIAAAATQSRTGLLAALVDPSILAGLLVAQAIVLCWRLIAVASVMTDRTFPRSRSADVLAVVVVLALVALPQAGAGYVTNVARESALEIFAPSIADAFPSAPPPASSLAPAFSPAVSWSPSPGSTPAPARVTVLLIGQDSGVGRNTALTDTMIVASLDRVAKTVSMASVPRDLVDAPLPGGGTFAPKVNSLAAYVRWHPNEFPGYKGNGQAVLAYALGTMLGVHIDYYAQVDLGGFVQVVNAVGGVDVEVDHAICDPRYFEYGFTGFSIGAGRHHMNGNTALAYSRIRKALGESDFTRQARQQQVIVALKDRVVKGGFLDDPVGLLRALGATVQTNIPPAVIRDLAPFATDISAHDVYRAVVGHPFVRPGFDVRGSIQIPDLAAIARLGAQLFTPVGTPPLGLYQTTPSTGVARGPAQAAPVCVLPKSTPRPTPTPTPALSPLPGETAAPSVGPSETPALSPQPAPTVSPGPTPSPSS
jgi:LCP family protein required for cell wall assembly